jgi:glycosyltransferase involved in cell wall biosynthesis
MSEAPALKIVSAMTTNSAGGAEFAAVEMLAALAERGHEVVMLTDLSGISSNGAVPIVPVEMGPKLSTRSWRHLMRNWLGYVSRFRAALERQAPYDVLIVHYKKEQLMIPWLPRRLRPRVAWAEWGPVPFQFRRGLPRRAYLHASRQAKVVMAVSAGTKTSVESVGVPASKVVLVPNVVNADVIRFTEQGRREVRERLDIAPDAFVVGCVSRFHPKKRNDVVIDAVIALDDPRVHLIMAGSGETEAALRAQAGPLGERAHFLPMPTSDLANVMSALDVSVFCPSPTEGAPRATIVGMLAERPCLASGAEGVADLIAPEFGAIAQPDHDPAALAAVLRRYLEDPSLGPRQGKAARAWAERQYAGPVVAAQIEHLLSGER